MSSQIRDAFQFGDGMRMSENESGGENGQLFSANVATQNQFGELGGWGSDDFELVRRRKPKRKKVSSDSMSVSTFNNLPNDEKLNCMFENLSKNYEMLSEMRNTQEKYYATTRSLQSGVTGLYERADKVDKVLQNHTDMLKVLAYRSVDSEARSRRNNLIIWGVTERLRLSCDVPVQRFVENELGMDTSSLVIDRAHRIGSLDNPSYRGKADPKRPIIVSFRDYSDTEQIMRKAYKLKGSPFGIDRDFPKEIADARKELHKSQAAKDARSQKHKVRIQYPAKLTVNDELVCDKFPEWSTAMKVDRIKTVKDIDTRASMQVTHKNLPDGGNANQSSYVIDTDIDSEHSTSESSVDMINEEVFTSTQIQSQTPLSSTGQNINKHAHSSTTRSDVYASVSRDNASHATAHVVSSKPTKSTSDLPGSPRRQRSGSRPCDPQPV